MRCFVVLVLSSCGFFTFGNTDIRWNDAIFGDFSDLQKTSELGLEEWLMAYEQEANKVYHAGVDYGWRYFTNVTEYNRNLLAAAEQSVAQFRHNTGKIANEFDIDAMTNQTLKTILHLLRQTDVAGMEAADFGKYHKLLFDMSVQLSNTTICDNGQPPPCRLYLDPDIVNIMSSSRNFDALYYFWNAWRDKAGPDMRKPFSELVHLSNKAARLNGYADFGELWRAEYGDPEFLPTVMRMYDELKPLYTQLHAYVRRRLDMMYPGYLFKEGPLPEHLMGDMWGSNWLSLYDFTAPYPGKWSYDPTTAMMQKNMTVTQMLDMTDRFYQSLGLPPLPSTVKQRSLLVHPMDRPVVCIPAAVDFKDGQDFRLKMCSQVTIDDLMEMHEQVAHVQYFMGTAHLPSPLRDGPTPAFHDAVAGAIGLTVKNQEYIAKIGLVPKVDEDAEKDVNYLYRSALQNLPFIMFSLTADMWRWGVFSAECPKERWNECWWELREKYSGIVPPHPRDDQYFDPGASFHVIQNTPYIKYFVGYILQFQILESLCTADGYTGPLQRCDIKDSEEAGKRLKTIFRSGASLPWQEILQQSTGYSQLTAKPLLAYYAPLLSWLENDNKKYSQYIGWNGSREPFDNPALAQNDGVDSFSPGLKIESVTSYPALAQNDGVDSFSPGLKISIQKQSGDNGGQSEAIFDEGDSTTRRMPVIVHYADTAKSRLPTFATTATTLLFLSLLM